MKSATLGEEREGQRERGKRTGGTDFKLTSET